MTTSDAMALRPFPKLVDIKPGDILEADAGFPCIPNGARLVVQGDGHGLFIHCCGPDDEQDPMCHHYLDGQENEDGECIGLYKVATP